MNPGAMPYLSGADVNTDSRYRGCCMYRMHACWNLYRDAVPFLTLLVLGSCACLS
jgi:hypothetical protein